MLINLISWYNGCGLEMEYELLREFFNKEFPGAKLNAINLHPKNPKAFQNVRPADINLFNEICDANLFGMACDNYLIINPEWSTCDREFAGLTRVLCKTHDSHRIISAVTEKAVYTGYWTRDLYDRSIKREPLWMHLVGGAGQKNTEATLAAWKMFDNPPRLYVVGARGNYYKDETLRNVFFTGSVALPALKGLMNACQYHIMPSAYEGYGHALWEGLSVGAVLVTTAMPPMNEAADPRVPQVQPATYRRVMRAVVGLMTAESIYEAVQQTMALKPKEVATISADAREKFLRERAAAQQRFKTVIEQGNSLPYPKVFNLPWIKIEPPQYGRETSPTMRYRVFMSAKFPPIFHARFPWKPALAPQDRKVVINVDYAVKTIEDPAAFKVFLQYEPQCVFTLEGPNKVNVLHIIEDCNNYNVVLCWNPQILAKCPNAVYFNGPACCSWNGQGAGPGDENSWYENMAKPFNLTYTDFPERDYGVSFQVSAKNWTPGHRFRLALFDKVKAPLPSKLVLEAVKTSGLVMNKTQPWLDKRKMMYSYEYSIVVENSFEENYFSEKIIDAFIAKTVPFYWGCPNIGQWFDESGIIRFSNYEDLMEKMEDITPDTYHRMLPMLEENYTRALKWASLNDRLEKTLTTALLKTPTEKLALGPKVLRDGKLVQLDSKGVPIA
jgi:hypothetical protein